MAKMKNVNSYSILFLLFILLSFKPNYSQINSTNSISLKDKINIEPFNQFNKEGININNNNNYNNNRDNNTINNFNFNNTNNQIIINKTNNSDNQSNMRYDININSLNPTTKNQIINNIQNGLNFTKEKDFGKVTINDLDEKKEVVIFKKKKKSRKFLYFILFILIISCIYYCRFKSKNSNDGINYSQISKYSYYDF